MAKTAGSFFAKKLRCGFVDNFNILLIFTGKNIQEFFSFLTIEKLFIYSKKSLVFHQ